MNQKNNYLEEHFDEVREQFDLLNYWIFFNAAAQMIPGKYWLKAIRDYFDFLERGRFEETPIPDIAAHPWVASIFFECVERSAKFIHADKEEVTMMYRPMQAGNLIADIFDWKEGDNIVFSDLAYPSFPCIFK